MALGGYVRPDWMREVLEVMVAERQILSLRRMADSKLLLELVAPGELQNI